MSDTPAEKERPPRPRLPLWGHIYAIAGIWALVACWMQLVTLTINVG
jgi:hypothetical protein